MTEPQPAAPEPGGTTPQPPRRRFRHWLTVSLLVNALLLGLLAGGWLRQSHHGRPAHPGIERPFADASRAERRAVRQVFREAWSEAAQARAQRADAREALAGALATEPYDAQAVLAAFARTREADATFQQTLHEGLAARIGSLSPETRAVFAERVGREGGRGRGHRGRFGDRGDGPPDEADQDTP